MFMKILSLFMTLTFFASIEIQAQNQLPTVDYSQLNQIQTQNNAQRDPASTGQNAEFLNELKQVQGQGGSGLSAADQQQLLQQLKQFKEQEKERQQLLEDLMAEP